MNTTIEPRSTRMLDKTIFYGRIEPTSTTLERMRSELTEQRQRLQIETEGSYRSTAQTNIESLEGWIADAEREIEYQTARERAREEQQAAAKAATEAAAETKLRAELRSRFMGANPGASDADFEAVYPRLKADRQIERMAAAEAGARAAMRRHGI